MQLEMPSPSLLTQQKIVSDKPRVIKIKSKNLVGN
jgi:hypothetical protein